MSEQIKYYYYYYYYKLPHLFIPSKIATLVPVYSGRPAFGQNCTLGARVCSERPVLGQNTHDDDGDDFDKKINDEKFSAM